MSLIEIKKEKSLFNDGKPAKILMAKGTQFLI